MKKFFAFFVLALLSLDSFAQAKVREVVADDYNRNSLSVIYVWRGDALDEELCGYLFERVFNEEATGKFDLNMTQTAAVVANVPRASAVAESSLRSSVESENIGREVLACWYNRQDSGEMDASVIEERGRYNANDQAYLNAQIGKLGVAGLGDEGYKLIARSYIMVTDYSGVGYSTDKDGKKTWTATTNTHVYQVSYDADVQAAVNDAWIYEDDDAAAREYKMSVWQALSPQLKYRASATYTSSVAESDGGLQSAVQNGYTGCIEKLEKLIGEWNVTTSITDRKPIRAKIGKKEGVKNGKRFQAYKFKEDRNGNLKSIPKGYLRATEVANNIGYAAGSSPKSEFYQISGGHLEEGYLLKQKNDLGMGVSLGYKVNGFTPYNLGIDYLAHINTGGSAHYALMNIGYDVYTESKLRKHDMYTSDGEDGGVSFIDLGLGYGFGFRPIRHLEIVPFVMASGEYMMFNSDLWNSDSDEDESSFTDKVAWLGTAGVKVHLNVKYPFQIFAQADYTINIYQGEIYKANNDVLDANDLGRKHKVGFMFGVRWIF